MKKGKTIAVILAASMILTGCIDEMPDMTKEQTDLVAEYAAGLLLKYSSNYQYPLADVEELPVEETTEETTEETAEEETTQMSSESTDEKEERETSPDHAETSETLEIEENQSILGVDLASYFGESTCHISYDGYEVADRFPTNNTSFCVSASRGHQLLVAKFHVTNETGTATTCDLYENSPSIQASVNGSSKVKALNTLLTNDITTFIGEISENSSMEMVAVFEISEEETDIDFLTLTFGQTEFETE